MVIAWVTAGAAVLLQMLTNGRYRYFRDELYFLAAGDHLAWGYVDFAPLVALLARGEQALDGILPRQPPCGDIGRLSVRFRRFSRQARWTARHSASTLPTMTDDRKGGIALIVWAVGGIITMSLHPTGGDLLAPGQFAPMALLIAGVHALALAIMPVALLGALALSRRLAAPDRLAVAALVVFGFALAAAMAAGTVSGFVAPGLARELVDATPAASDGWRLVFDYSGRLNQAFALVFVLASSTSIVLWSAAMVRNRALAPGAGIYGLLLGPAIVLAVASGHLRLHVHGFGLIILAQAIWWVVVGAFMCRRAAAPAEQ